MSALSTSIPPAAFPVPVGPPAAGLRPSLPAVFDHVVADCLAELGVTEPPAPAGLLVQRLGLTVLTEHERRSQHTRRRIAALLLPQAAARLGRPLSSVTAAEGQAWTTALAQRLAIPTEWIVQDGPALDWNVPALARRYGCAPGMVARRMLAVRDALTVTIFADNWLVFRESRPQQVRPLTALELACRAQVMVTGRPADLRRGGQRVQGWAFCRRGRAREILCETSG